MSWRRVPARLLDWAVSDERRAMKVAEAWGVAQGLRRRIRAGETELWNAAGLPSGDELGAVGRALEAAIRRARRLASRLDGLPGA